jgi:hypothetical protein
VYDAQRASFEGTSSLNAWQLRNASSAAALCLVLPPQESGTSSTGEELASERAFKCFVRAVHALQSLDLQGDTVPQVRLGARGHMPTWRRPLVCVQRDCCCSGPSAACSTSSLAMPAPARRPQVFVEIVQPGLESREMHVLEDEQADLYSCWAESVLLKFR